MKKLFGVALLVLPLLTASAQAEGWPFNIQAGGSFYIKGSSGAASPNAGPCFSYWPLEAHFVAPAPTGYPYWPGPQVLPATSFGGPSCPPGTPVLPPSLAAAPPSPAVAPAPAPVPAPQPAPQGAPQTTPRSVPPAAPNAAPQNSILPPYLQPTAYSLISYTGQWPSYWYDR